MSEAIISVKKTLPTPRTKFAFQIWMIILLLLLIGTLKIIGKNIRHLVFKAPCHGNEKKKESIMFRSPER